MKAKPIKAKAERERVIRLSSDDAVFLGKLLEKPPAPNARLRKALQTYEAMVKQARAAARWRRGANPAR